MVSSQPSPSSPTFPTLPSSFPPSYSSLLLGSLPLHPPPFHSTLLLSVLHLYLTRLILCVHHNPHLAQSPLSPPPSLPLPPPPPSPSLPSPPPPPHQVNLVLPYLTGLTLCIHHNPHLVQGQDQNLTRLKVCLCCLLFFCLYACNKHYYIGTEQYCSVCIIFCVCSISCTLVLHCTPICPYSINKWLLSPMGPHFYFTNG